MTEPERNLENTPLLSNKTYDFLVRLVQLGLPAFASLYFGLSQIFGLPNGEQVVAAAALFATFFGVLLKISNSSYASSGAKYAGVINVDTPTPDSTVYSLELDGDPADIAQMKQVTFKINPPR